MNGHKVRWSAPLTPRRGIHASITRRVDGQEPACHEVNDRFRRSVEIGDTVFCCVDKIDIRQLIWQSVKDRVTFFVDGRMSAEVLRVLTACDPGSREHYPTTLFTAEDAYQGACTAKTTIYCANIAAGPDAGPVRQVSTATSG